MIWEWITSLDQEMILSLSAEYHIPLIILATLSNGELATHSLGILTAGLKTPLYTPLLICATVFTYDMCAYGITYWIKKKQFRFLHKKKPQWLEALHNVYLSLEERGRGRSVSLLLLLKLLPLSKFTIIFYLLRQKHSFGRFVLQDCLAILSWLAILFGTGLVIGFGLLSVEEGGFLKNIIIYLFVAILASSFFKKDIERFFGRLLSRKSTE